MLDFVHYMIFDYAVHPKPQHIDELNRFIESLERSPLTEAKSLIPIVKGFIQTYLHENKEKLNKHIHEQLQEDLNLLNSYYDSTAKIASEKTSATSTYLDSMVDNRDRLVTAYHWLHAYEEYLSDSTSFFIDNKKARSAHVIEDESERSSERRREMRFFSVPVRYKDPKKNKTVEATVRFTLDGRDYYSVSRCWFRILDASGKEIKGFNAEDYAQGTSFKTYPNVQELEFDFSKQKTNCLSRDNKKLEFSLVGDTLVGKAEGKTIIELGFAWNVTHAPIAHINEIPKLVEQLNGQINDKRSEKGLGEEPNQPYLRSAEKSELTNDSAARLLGFESLDAVNSNSLKQNYRRLALKHHPDKGGSSERFNENNAANELLVEYLRGLQNNFELNFKDGTKQCFNIEDESDGQLLQTLQEVLQTIKWEKIQVKGFFGKRGGKPSHVGDIEKILASQDNDELKILRIHQQLCDALNYSEVTGVIAEKPKDRDPNAQAFYVALFNATQKRITTAPVADEGLDKESSKKFGGLD